MSTFKQYLNEWSGDDERRMRIIHSKPSEQQRLRSPAQATASRPVPPKPKVPVKPGLVRASNELPRKLKPLNEKKPWKPAPLTDIEKRKKEAEARITPKMRAGQGKSGVEKEYTGKDEPENETAAQKAERIRRHRGASWKGGT